MVREPEHAEELGRLFTGLPESKWRKRRERSGGPLTAGATEVPA